MIRGHECIEGVVLYWYKQMERERIKASKTCSIFKLTCKKKSGQDLKTWREVQGIPTPQQLILTSTCPPFQERYAQKQDKPKNSANGNI